MYETQSKLKPKLVWFPGTTAIAQGQGLCYDHVNTGSETAEGATYPWGKRDKIVAVPSATNNNSFAGVASASYAANALGQWIYIYEPGSICLVATKETALTLLDKTFICCNIDATYNGYFYSAGAGRGKGNARVMQTISAAGLVMCELMDGDESGLVQRVALPLAGAAITAPAAGAFVVFDGTAVNTDHCTYTLANGTFVGQRCGMLISVTIGNSKNLVVTVTAGLKIDDTALSTLTFNTAAEAALLEWTGSAWKVISTIGTTVA